jgi:hypothetical protein
MFSLEKQIAEYDKVKTDDRVDRDELDVFMHDVIQAARTYTSSDHIMLTYANGTCGQRGVTWNVDEQRFSDWIGNFWLYGPDSHRGQSAGGKWVIDTRHDTALLNELKKQAEWAAKFDSVQMIWRIYWQMILDEQIAHADDTTIIDLRIRPLDVNALAKRHVSGIPVIEITVDNPNWNTCDNSPLDWRSYVEAGDRSVWNLLTHCGKDALYRAAQANVERSKEGTSPAI